MVPPLALITPTLVVSMPSHRSSSRLEGKKFAPLGGQLHACVALRSAQRFPFLAREFIPGRVFFLAFSVEPEHRPFEVNTTGSRTYRVSSCCLCGAQTPLDRVVGRAKFFPAVGNPL